jgi:hypothetical protein
MTRMHLRQHDLLNRITSTVQVMPAVSGWGVVKEVGMIDGKRFDTDHAAELKLGR